MAVYTKLKKENIEEILLNYSIGKLNTFKGIQQGIENTNYFLLVDNKRRIRGIYDGTDKTEISKIKNDIETLLMSDSY